MNHVVIIGCGVIGAAIAYELSLLPRLKITVLDQQAPAQASTGAALGVLMGVISHKVKGNAWRLRQTSLQRYETLIPELEALTGRQIAFNRQGILRLCSGGEELSDWQKLVEIRASQGYQLQIWDSNKLRENCPQVGNEKITAAIYSPQDRQLNPTALTRALVNGAMHNGVTFKFGSIALGIQENGVVQTTEGTITADWVILASGLGSTPLTAQLNQMVDIRPVLGQALQLSAENPLGNSDFQPVITSNDVRIVPLGGGEYWIGTTVEFPKDNQEIVPETELLQSVHQQAIALCPELATATVIKTWSGLRPRPTGRPAPVIGKLPGFDHILLATGHYRNGILLAPATAYAIREIITSK